MSSLENALQILDLLQPDRPTLRVGDVCRRTGIPKSSVSRLLKTMQDSGLLERGADDLAYVAGSRCLALSQLYLSRQVPFDLARQAVSSIVAEFGFTGYLAVLSDAEIVLLATDQGSYPLRYVRPVGSRLPVVHTAMGRAMLARLSEAEIAAVGLSLKAIDPDLDLAALNREREDIIRSGFVQTGSAFVPGILTFSTAVRPEGTAEPMAVGLAYPGNVVDDATRERMRHRMIEVTRSLGRNVRDPYWA